MTAHVDIWEEERGRWRWAFRDADLEFLSNQLYHSSEEAAGAARLAYPGVPVGGPVGDGHAAPGPVSLASFLLAVLALWRDYRRSRRR
jgi:hypothetical protein